MKKIGSEPMTAGYEATAPTTAPGKANLHQKFDVSVFLLQRAVEGLLQDDDVGLQLLGLGVASEVPPVLGQLAAVQVTLPLLLSHFQLKSENFCCHILSILSFELVS